MPRNIVRVRQNELQGNPFQTQQRIPAATTKVPRWKTGQQLNRAGTIPWGSLNVWAVPRGRLTGTQTDESHNSLLSPGSLLEKSFKCVWLSAWWTDKRTCINSRVEWCNVHVGFISMDCEGDPYSFFLGNLRCVTSWPADSGDDLSARCSF